MRFQFDATRSYKLRAIEAVADSFRGQPKVALDLTSFEAGEIFGPVPNRLDLPEDRLLEDLRDLQRWLGIREGGKLNADELALETLRKLLNDQIKISERTNLVQARKFRASLEKAMLGYTNKQITTVEIIAQLRELAKWVREAKKHGHDLGLSGEETAFYDALAENGSAKSAMKSDSLLGMMARQVNLTRKQFNDLVDCPLTIDEYVRLLRTAGHVAKPAEQ